MMNRRQSKLSRIKQHLLNGIRLRHFTDRLPSENRLAATFSVSRMTARKALNDLAAEGIVERIQGKGTFVNTRDPSLSCFIVKPSKIQAADLGVRYRAAVLEQTLVSRPPAAIATQLGDDRQVIRVRRMHYFDDRAVRYEDRYLRGDLCGAILWEDLAARSIHDLLVNKYDLPLTRVHQRITAVALGSQTAALFGERAGYPAFRLQRTTYTLEQAVTVVDYLIRGELAFEDSFAPGSLNTAGRHVPLPNASTHKS